jgi:hypothetical protein
MSSLKYLRKLAGIEERAPAHTPTPLKHCVAKVASEKDGDTSRAFAICTAALQKAKVLKKGTKTLTAKGKGKASAHAKEPDAAEKLGDYEKLLAASRKQDSTGVGESKRPQSGEWLPPPSGGMHKAPLGTVRHLAGSYKGGEKKHAFLKVSHEGWRGWKYLGKATRHPEHTPQEEAVIAPEVLKHLSEGTERFWELAGLTDGPSIAYGSGWVLPEWGSTNERPLESVPEEWKALTVKSPPLPKKGQQYSPEGGQHEAYQSLGQALAALELPISDGKTRKVDPQEFVYRGQHTDDAGKTTWVHFKHRDTRNTVHLDLQDHALVIPKNDAPFQRGQFDKVESSDVYARLRSLAGIE